MLTEGGYHGALLIYVAAACVALLLANLWLLKGAGLYLRVLLSLPVAALLLTPAYTDPDGGTLAPALIVAAFSWLSIGPEAAQHALRPLLTFSVLALVLALVACVLVFVVQRARLSRQSR
jgi:hypothetical protein